MRTLALALVFAGACGASQKPAAAPPPAPASSLRAGLNIKHAIIYVDDQDKALAFYTDVLGFAKKDDVTNGPFRWLTVTAPEDRDGTELQLAPNGDPATLAYQQSLHDQGQPAAMFFTA